MKWDNIDIRNYGWNSEITNYVQKSIVAHKVAQIAKNGDVIGFGSGSTAYLAVLEIAKRVENDGLKIKAIPTSKEIAFICLELGIPITSILEEKPDWCFDGADEVSQNQDLIKGRGGAMFNEKLVMKSSDKSYIIVDESKFVTELGEKFSVPVEITQSSMPYVVRELEKLNAIYISLRPAKSKDGPLITENGNFILDVRFNKIESHYEKEIKAITGVIETGLFIGYDLEVIKV